MLACVQGAGRGEADRLIWSLAARLRALGWPLAGAVQENREFGAAEPCEMNLHILAGQDVVRISQRLGPLARGCRLDSAGLERAVGLVAAALAEAPRLLIINKFGKREVEGRGFRPLIGQALAQGVPVLTAASQSNVAGFEAFADGMATLLPANLDAVMAWCLALPAPD